MRHFSEMTPEEIQTLWQRITSATIDYVKQIGISGLSQVGSHDLYKSMFNAISTEWNLSRIIANEVMLDEEYDDYKYNLRRRKYKKRLKQDELSIYYRKHKRKQVDELSDRYVRGLLSQKLGLSSKLIPQELVELKREQLKKYRLMQMLNRSIRDITKK